MHSIEQFNKILNVDKQNRFELWKDYRKSITEYVVLNISKFHHNRNMLIIGAGNSDDLDLGVLSKLSKSITLSDIDIQAMNNAILKYHLDSTKTKVKKVDYVGLDFDKNIL